MEGGCSLEIVVRVFARIGQYGLVVEVDEPFVALALRQVG